MRASSRQAASLIFAATAFFAGCAGFSQTTSSPTVTSSPAPVARVLGTVTAITGNTVTVKPDAGVEQKVTVQDSTRMLQTAPGQTTLSGATAIHVQDLEVGDRVSVRGTASGDWASINATSLIAMKQADLQKKQEADREDWQKRGIGGVVKSVDPATATITATTGAGAAAKVMAIHAAKTTVIRRYAADSAKLADSKVTTLDQVKPGDQLEARGTRSEDGSELAAEDIVVGSFRNLAGTISAVDKSAGTISLIDLASKEPYVIRCTADSQLRKLPPLMAQMLAARLKSPGGGGATANKPGPPAASRPSSAAMGASADASAGEGGPTADPGGGPPGARPSGGRPGGGAQQMLNRAPVIQLSDLQKGDVVMVVSTEGVAPGAGPAATPGSSTAITLIAGVEPMLQASASGSQSLLSSSWSLGSGAPEGSQ